MSDASLHRDTDKAERTTGASYILDFHNSGTPPPPISNWHHYMKIDSYMKTGGSVLININIHVMVLKPAHVPIPGC